MAPHSSTLAWKIPWTPGGLQSMGSLGVGHDSATSLSLSCIGEGNGNPLQFSCLENPRWAAVYGVAQSRTRLRRLSSSSSSSYINIILMCWLLNLSVSVFLSLNGDAINTLFDCVIIKLFDILITLSSWSMPSEPYWWWRNAIWELPFLWNENNFRCSSYFTRLLWGLKQVIQGSILCRCIQHRLFGPGSEPRTEWLTTEALTDLILFWTCSEEVFGGVHTIMAVKLLHCVS